MKKTLLLALALLLPLAASCAGSREVLVASPARIDSEQLSPPVPTDPAAVLPVDPEMTTGTLANGMRYFIRSNGVPADRAEIWLAVNAGSVLEDDDQRGLAHFIEHMAFNGTQHFAKQELVKYLESIGMRFGADINASTGYDETVYTLTVPTDKPEYVNKAFEILDDWAHAITFDPREVDSERGVVIEEWRLGRGAEARMMDEQFPVLFQGSRYTERQPIGKKDILETVDAAALKRFYHDWYRPDLMAVIVVGDVDPRQIEAQVKRQFSHLRGPATSSRSPGTRTRWWPSPPIPKRPRARWASTPSATSGPRTTWGTTGAASSRASTTGCSTPASTSWPGAPIRRSSSGCPPRAGSCAPPR
jgi:zinc protease